MKQGTDSYSMKHETATFRPYQYGVLLVGGVTLCMMFRAVQNAIFAQQLHGCTSNNSDTFVDFFKFMLQ